MSASAQSGWVQPLTLALVLGCLAMGLGVIHACRPSVPLFDHAVLLSDVLHRPPHLFRGHNEHLPVLPRLVFLVEATLTRGSTALGVGVAVASLLGGSALVGQVWRPERRIWAAVLAAGLLRPSLAWSVAWPTNLQYALAWLGSCVAAVAWVRQRWALCALGALCAGLSSAEGWLVLPLLGAAELVRGRRRAALGWALAMAVAAGIATRAETAHSALRIPVDLYELRQWGAYLGALLSHPWSTRLGLAVSLPLVLWALRAGRRQGRVDAAFALVAAQGAGFALLVAVGRWWRPEVAPRYALGPTIAVLAGVAAVGVVRGGSSRWLALVLAGGLLTESLWLSPDRIQQCRAQAPAGTDFWLGLTDDASAAHPGHASAIAVELRDHVWEWGLYRPEAEGDSPSGRLRSSGSPRPP